MTYDTTGTEFSLTSIKKLIKKHTDKRISDQAAITMAEQLEEKAAEETRKAVRNAEHADRATVTADDLELHRTQ